MTRLLKFITILILSGGLFGQAVAGAIHEAAKNGDVESIKSILAEDPSQLNTQDWLGYTPVNWAANRGQWDAMIFLIEAGADVNAPGLDGCISLHAACNHDHPDMIALLLDKGADQSWKNAWGNIPLHVAAQDGCPKVVALLIARGADINAVSDEGWTPLHYARKCDHPEVTEILIEAGASQTAVDDFGKTPMDYNFKRPPAIPLETARMDEYVGNYSFPGGFYVKVWVDNDRLWLQDYSHDMMYPIGPDSFFCESKAWMVYFGRDEQGAIDSIFLAFLRQTVAAVKTEGEMVSLSPKPRLGLRCREVATKSLSDADRKIAFSDGKPDATAAYVMFVLNGSPADRAGIMLKDIILKFNNIKVASHADLGQQLAGIAAGTEVPVEILRDGEVVTKTVRLE